MKKSFKRIIIAICLLFGWVSNAYAASFTVSVGSQNLTKGGSTKLTIKGSDVTGRFNISSSNSGVVSVSEDRAWIENNSYTVTLTANGVGSATITVSPSGVSDSSGSSASLSAKSIKINVALPREKSTDNNLKSLSVEGYTITPEFSKDVLDYKVTVPEGTTSVKINASANSGYAKVSGAGEQIISEGLNNLSVVVTSESGSKKTYNIEVDVIDPTPIIVPINNVNWTVVKLRDNFKCPELFQESEVVIAGTNIPACKNDKVNYVLVGLKDDNGNVKSYIYNEKAKDNKNYSLYSYAYSNSLQIIILDLKELDNVEKTTLTIDDVKYDAYQYNNSSRYYVVYGKNIETGEEGFYLYDSKNKTFSAYDSDFIDDLLNNSNNNIYLLTTIVFGVGLFLSIICIILLNKKKSVKKDRPKKQKEYIIEKAPEEEKITDNSDEEEVASEENNIEEIKEEEEEDILGEKPKKKSKKRKK